MTYEDWRKQNGLEDVDASKKKYDKWCDSNLAHYTESDLWEIENATKPGEDKYHIWSVGLLIFSIVVMLIIKSLPDSTEVQTPHTHETVKERVAVIERDTQPTREPSGLFKLLFHTDYSKNER